MPNYAHTVEVAASPSKVFAVLDDLTKTPQWLERCTKLDKLSDGPNAVGTKLICHYKQGHRLATMDGEIVTREPDRRLAMSFRDKMMDVTVDFAAAPAGADSTSLTHTITINPKGFGRVFGPVISRHLPEQTMDAMTTLKGMVEGA